MDADTQLIGYSPDASHSGESSDSEESSGSDSPSNQPTQLLYPQLSDSYDRYGEDMDDQIRTQQLDAMDMATQLIDEDFREHKGMGDDCTMIIHSEDEASKDTQLVNADGDSGASSGKDDEADSALSPYGAAFKQKTSHWLSEMAGKRRAENASTFLTGEKSAGLSYDVHGNRFNSMGSEPASNLHKCNNTEAGLGNPVKMQNRDSELPHFLKDSDLNKQNYGSHRMVGTWHEIVGQRNRCNEDERVWASAVGGLHLQDSDGSTEDERREEDDKKCNLNSSSTYHVEGNLSQSMRGRLSAYSSGNFCQQDLNKSPEPETLMMDEDWREVNGEDLGLIGRIDEGGSNVGLLDKPEVALISQTTPVGSRNSEGLPAEPRSLSKLHSNSRTSGSIRTLSLRASALRASSCSSSARYRHTPQGSQSQEVHKLETEATNETQCEEPWKTAKSADYITPTSRPSIQKGVFSSAASVASVWSNTEKAGEYSRDAEKEMLSGKVRDHIEGDFSGDKCGRSGKSVLGLEVPKFGDKNLCRARKLFSGNDNDADDIFSQVKVENVQKSPSPARDDGAAREKVEITPPTITDSQADKTLERRSSFGSGVFSGGSELSYLNFQSPGEDSQARALNMVDKLVWLNAIGLPQELQLEEEKAPARCPSVAKSALQLRVQVAEAKVGMNDPLGVFDWVDSQNDEAGNFFGIKGASALKGTSKAPVAMGHPKQTGFGTRKSVFLDAYGLRNKKMEKVSDKPFKPAVIADRPKAVVHKNMSGPKDNKGEQHGKLSRDATNAGLTSTLNEPGLVQTSLHVDAPRNVIGNKMLQDNRDNRGMKNVEGDTVISAVDISRLDLTSNAAVQRSSGLLGGHGSEGLPKGVGPQDSRQAPRCLEQPPKTPDVHKGSGKTVSDKQADEALSASKGKGSSDLPHVPSKPGQKGKSLQTVISPRDNGPEGFQEPAASRKNEKAESTLGDGLSELTHSRQDSNANQQAEGRLTGLTGFPCLNASKVLIPSTKDQLGGGLTTTDLSDVPCCPNRPVDIGNQAHSTEAEVQPQKLETAAGEDKLGEARIEVDNKDGKQIELFLKFDGVLENDCMDCDVDGSIGARGSVSSTLLSTDKEGEDEKEAEENAEVVSVREIHMGPDTLGAVEAMEMLSSDCLASSGDGSDEPATSKDPAGSPATVHPVSSDDKTTGLNTETHDGVVEGRRIVTRRSRTQGRQSTRFESTDPINSFRDVKMRGRNRRVEGTDPPIGKYTDPKDRARNRRVSWAGPVEQVPRRPVQVRRGRSARHQQHVCTEEERADNARQNSDHEEAEDVKDAGNGDRKRKVEALEVAVSKDTDLDKIKRRFNMSDAAVARLLGTDEDEDAEVNLSPGVKIRSLSHMQPPEAEENENVDAPKVRKAGKGLRSSRSRGEDGSINGRRKRACTTSSDLEKQGGDEMKGSPCDTDAADTSVDGTACVEAHPSDTEALPGRRRMRSIADVSSPVKKTLPGRPPQGSGLRRGRGRRLPRAPGEQKADPSDAEQVEVPPQPPPPPPPPPPSTTPAFPSISGRLRGKGGPRSARKRKELEPLTVEVSATSPTSSKEASTTSSKEDSKRRKGEAISTCVLFSHGLADDVGKQQRKIVKKLGGRVTTSAAECTHFVADKFVRTGNMLEAMAAGKPVITAEWLDNCLEAQGFVNEQAYILKDTRKEDEMGFCMVSTLNAAQQRPLLQDIRVYITPGTSPGPEALARIVKAAGGQVVDEYIGPAPDGVRESDYCLVLSSEEELETCSPLLEQGAKVFTPELLLSGVMCHKLDFSNDQLFKSFNNRRRRASLSRRTTL
ncbi:hypothetical protein MPTK1_1g29270 [Marchantia polymorpha subsp. ruderalis]|uniref:BRCT domain-containing protein n=2 Tax=Marchantia polymorpha TaxID=3197 RepID=A0AAF6AVH6_MARPO|nr:hypothetical protein MARPO_0107s0042 [Marchantia polymorpha]BBN00447.1 hypothetical protein Mp_1g29270 [Marchantia polymorpha subsp. ruderalis]|eukprot:PTQ31775.1 hypothetical protein MARPO_0107s0042 [Marchantia polymorpha]